ncbi:hypothetical protein [Caulifigura coniformis]|nr:hypothetical protein [Caulifigura coniformis]
MKLARHSDLKMTIAYSHIPLKDQARALAALPNPCQHIGRISGVVSSPAEAPRGTVGQSTDDPTVDGTLSRKSASGTKGQKKSPADKAGDEWRQQDAN